MMRFYTCVNCKLIEIPVEIFNYLSASESLMESVPSSCSLSSVQTWLKTLNVFMLRFKCAHSYSGTILRKIAKLERSLLVQNEYLTTATNKLNTLSEREAQKPVRISNTSDSAPRTKKRSRPKTLSKKKRAVKKPKNKK